MRPIVDLGATGAGLTRGRSRSDAITVCDLTGTGVRDTAIALFARRRAAEPRVDAGSG